MSESSPDYDVVLNEEKKRFELVEEGHMARVNYIMLSPTSIIFTHTVVPFALKGQGIGSFLARHVLDYARDNSLYVIPQCPFIRAYIDRHPEYDDLVQKSTR
jgi:predicted GNAT family acetyltransferase